MFTGLIEKTTVLKDIKTSSSGSVIYFEADFDNVKIGDSIAVNGVCLTITSIDNNILSADIMPESLNLTNLKKLKKGDLINLERAMSVNSRFDGHIVTGHIDCCAEVKNIIQDGFSKKIIFKCNSELIVKKGSITINGISLTVSNLFNDGFEVSLIPQTIEKTNLKNIKIGDIVNIEYDILAKYIKKFTQKKEDSKITIDFLKENGF